MSQHTRRSLLVPIRYSLDDRQSCDVELSSVCCQFIVRFKGVAHILCVEYHDWNSDKLTDDIFTHIVDLASGLNNG